MTDTLENHALDSRMARVRVDPAASLDDSIKRGLMTHSLLGEPRPKIGPYEILRRLGSGGMGVVYAGHDDELDRTIALKLLHQRTGPTARMRFAREAQGLARLSHPNVVQVYEIGEHQGSSFIAMEFVDGRTLKDWGKAGPQPWREVLKVMIDAGRGLAAAHRKRLVHRDFKPDNVMIGEEGRVLVMDFGLVHAGSDESTAADHDPSARVDDDRPVDDANANTTVDIETTADHAHGLDALDDLDGLDALDEETRSPLANSLTQTGTLLGTPAYMAPEQYLGRTTDARSDQFSFCVTAWELLYGQRPFPGSTVAELFSAVTSGQRGEPPAEVEVPGWVRKVLERGLAADPSERWPSMDALLDALTRDPTRRRRWWTAGAAVLSVSLVTWAVYEVQARAERDATLEACSTEAEAITEGWNPEREAALAAGFEATHLDFADDSWARTRTSLAAYASEWTRLRKTSCVEARVDHSRPLEQLPAIVACLDEARAGFDATLDVLATADAGLVAHAGALPTELPSLDACVDPRQLGERVSPPADVADRVATLRAKLERVRALHRSARYPSALELARELVDEAKAIAWAPLEAEALLVLGEQQHSLAQFDDAAASLRACARRAATARDDALALRAVTKLARVIGYDLTHTDEGLVWIETGAMLVARLGAEDSVADALLLGARGTIEGETGEHEQALADYERALAILERELGPDHPHVAAILHDLGGERFMGADFEGATRDVERSLSIREQVYGPNHPIVADSLATLGTIHDEQSDYPEARRLQQRALDIRSVALGPQHPRVASSLMALGQLDIYTGEFESARALIERALAIQELASGEDHPRVAELLDSLAAIDARTGELDRALALLERSLAIREAAYGPKHRLYAHSLANVAELHLMRGEGQLARTQLEQALAIKLEQVDPDDRDVAAVYQRLGNALAELGDLDGAIVHASRAVELLEASADPNDPELGTALFLLGTIQLEDGQGSAAAESLRRAVEIEEVTRQGAGVLADSAFVYAQALWAAGDRAAAREWAGKAADQHRDDAEPEPLAEVEAWLDTHRL